MSALIIPVILFVAIVIGGTIQELFFEED